MHPRFNRCRGGVEFHRSGTGGAATLGGVWRSGGRAAVISPYCEGFPTGSMPLCSSGGCWADYGPFRGGKLRKMAGRRRPVNGGEGSIGCDLAGARRVTLADIHLSTATGHAGGCRLEGKRRRRWLGGRWISTPLSFRAAPARRSPFRRGGKCAGNLIDRSMADVPAPPAWAGCVTGFGQRAGQSQLLGSCGDCQDLVKSNGVGAGNDGPPV
jgi:hypothetical protein